MNLLRNSFLLLFIFFGQLHAQEPDLLSDLELEDEVVRSRSSFKTTRVINSHSLETTHKRTLDMRISHRFGLITGGFYEFFGLDQATMRMGFDYGLTDRLQLGIGRSTYNKTVDGFAKYKILWQTEGSEKMPLSLVLVSGLAVNTLRFESLSFEMTLARRLQYSNQLVIGRKFNSKLSLQLMPTMVHRNLVETASEANTVFAAGIAGRYKFTKHMAVNMEYYYVPPDQIREEFNPSFSVGLDIETGGHVFQLFFSNSLGFIENAYIFESTASWLTGDIHFGFTISRVFSFEKKE